MTFDSADDAQETPSAGHTSTVKGPVSGEEMSVEEALTELFGYIESVGGTTGQLQGEIEQTQEQLDDLEDEIRDVVEIINQLHPDASIESEI